MSDDERALPVTEEWLKATGAERIGALTSLIRTWEWFGWGPRQRGSLLCHWEDGAPCVKVSHEGTTLMFAETRGQISDLLTGLQIPSTRTPDSFERHWDKQRFHVRTLCGEWQVHGVELEHICICTDLAMANMIADALEAAAEAKVV